MNLNHEIITFNDIDIISSKILIRMLLKGDKIIKRYKLVNLNLSELCINIKEKKIINFPFKSKLVFNYNLTNDKEIVSKFIKEVKYCRDIKRTKSIFDYNEDDDENLGEEESEDSSQEHLDKQDSNKNIEKIKNIEENCVDKNILEKNNNNSNNNNNKVKNNKTLSFRERLSIFEKQGNVPETNTMIKNKANCGKSNKIGNDKNKTFLLKIKSLEKQINTNNLKLNKNMQIDNKQDSLDDNKKDNININENKNNKIENIINKKEEKINEEEEIIEKEKEINLADNNIKEESKKDNNIIEEEINQEIIPEIHRGNKKNSIIQKTNLILDNKKEDINMNDKKNSFTQSLSPQKINIYKEKNLESFCNSFFLCSFPYKNGKILENSKDYKSSCNHPICGKLISMEPEIIYKFPPNDTNDLELNNLSASICFPTGIKNCYNQDRRTICKSFSTHIISQQGKKYYMVIYHFYRKLDSMTYNQLYFDNPLKLYLRQFGDNTFCNKVEQEQLEKDLAECQELGFRDFVFIPYAMVLISKYPYINQMRICLNVIYKIMSTNNEMINNLRENNKTNLIKDLLSYLIYSIPIPIVNSEISFNLPFYSEKIKISSPYKDKIRDLENINFPYIISKFCPDNIIDIYRYMLFEKRILFINKDYNKISTVIDSFTNILYPIDWVNTIIPIMSSPMVRYLQTFLPFINGIIEDLLEKKAKQALEEAEEGVFEIFIYNDTIKFSKPDYEEDIKNSIPKLPRDIYNKLYSELSDLAEVYKKLNDQEKEKYGDNVNNIVRNIFFESNCIMLYDLILIVLEEEKEFNGFSNSTLNKIYEKDAFFYKELTESQIFQNFINNFIKRKKDYTSFICMLKNISEKYVKSDLSNVKGKSKWKKFIRKITKKEVIQFPLTFRIPLHLLNPGEIISYVINNKEWKEINDKIEENYEGNKDLLKNNIIPENERTSVKIIEVNSDSKKLDQEIYRYIIPNKSNDKKRIRHSLSINLNNHLLLNSISNLESNLKKESELPNSLKEKMKNDFATTLNLILSNKTSENNKLKQSKFEQILSYVYYDIGKDILSKTLYKKGFRVALKLNDENYKYLNDICTNALISLCDSEENIINLEISVKIISSAFYYCKENCVEFLIDDLRNNLGKNYYYWNRESFWNTWQIMENYFSINDYNTYCRIIMHDFANKLLRIKLDKEFIISYLISSLGEKLILLEHNNDLSEKAIKNNQLIFSENRTKIIEIINNCAY